MKQIDLSELRNKLKDNIWLNLIREIVFLHVCMCVHLLFIATIIMNTDWFFSDLNILLNELIINKKASSYLLLISINFKKRESFKGEDQN